MLSELITIVTNFIMQVISGAGYFGVGLLMAIESAAIPLPSEIIMPFAGFLAGQGQFTLIGLAIAGGIGSAVGSAITYGVGRYGGRPFLEKYGKYLLISEHDLASSDKFFARWGMASSFIGRLLPVVRTFISVPAGVAKVNFVKFIIYSFLGSVLWSYFLAYLGKILGSKWFSLRETYHWVDYIVIFALFMGVLYVVYHKMRINKR